MTDALPRCASVSPQGLRCALDIGHAETHNALGPWVPSVAGYDERQRAARGEAQADIRQRSAAEMEAESEETPGFRLRWLRLRAGLTLGDMARYLKCSVVELSRIERGVAVKDKRT